MTGKFAPTRGNGDGPVSDDHLELILYLVRLYCLYPTGADRYTLIPSGLDSGISVVF